MRGVNSLMKHSLGPGCSSSMGLLMELGPCNIDMNNISPNGTTWNPYSWNNEANIFFLDQPYVSKPPSLSHHSW